MLLNYFKKIFILFFVGIFIVGCSGVPIDEGYDVDDDIIEEDLVDDTSEVVDDEIDIDDEVVDEDLIDDTDVIDDEVVDEEDDYVEGFEESVSELDEDDDIVIDDDLGLDIFG